MFISRKPCRTTYKRMLIFFHHKEIVHVQIYIHIHIPEQKDHLHENIKVFLRCYLGYPYYGGYGHGYGYHG